MEIMKRTLTFILAALLASCSYYNNEEYFVEHTPGPLPDISLSTSFDTIAGDIIVLDSIRFSYTVTVDSGMVYFTYLEFQGSEGFIQDTNSASVWIRPDSTLPEPSYDLNMSVAYKTNSGSLADLINAEYAVLDTSWNIIVKEEVE